MKFKTYDLDSFQIDAIHALEQGYSVVVSAATGTGKTLIAEYIIHNALIKNQGRVIYTAPIKALSNQKFKDFSSEYGKENVGMLTGDVVITPNGTGRIFDLRIYSTAISAAAIEFYFDNVDDHDGDVVLP